MYRSESMISIKYILLYLVCIGLFCAISSSAFAQSIESVESIETESDPFEASGAFMSLKIGPNLAAVELVGTHTRYGFTTSAMGISASLEAGYHWGMFSLSGVIKARSGWAISDKNYRHCVNNDENYCYSYSAIKKGEWDGYFMALGFRLGALVDIGDPENWSFLFNTGFDVPLGFSMDRKNIYATCLFVVGFGFQYAITKNLSLGLNLDLSIMIFTPPMSPPDNPLNNPNEDESLLGMPMYFYAEPTFLLTYNF